MTILLTEKQFKEALKELEIGLRIKKENKLSKIQYDIYYKYLKDLTNEQIMKAVKVIIKTYDISYFPSIAGIRNAAGANIEPPPKSLTIEDIQQLQA